VKPSFDNQPGHHIHSARPQPRAQDIPRAPAPPAAAAPGAPGAPRPQGQPSDAARIVPADHPLQAAGPGLVPREVQRVPLQAAPAAPAHGPAAPRRRAGGAARAEQRADVDGAHRLRAPGRPLLVSAAPAVIGQAHCSLSA